MANWPCIPGFLEKTRMGYNVPSLESNSKAAALELPVQRGSLDVSEPLTKELEQAPFLMATLWAVVVSGKQVETLTLLPLPRKE